jgi:hypothetical protein
MSFFFLLQNQRTGILEQVLPGGVGTGGKGKRWRKDVGE